MSLSYPLPPFHCNMGDGEYNIVNNLLCGCLMFCVPLPQSPNGRGELDRFHRACDVHIPEDEDEAVKEAFARFFCWDGTLDVDSVGGTIYQVWVWLCMLLYCTCPIFVSVHQSFYSVCSKCVCVFVCGFCLSLNLCIFECVCVCFLCPCLCSLSMRVFSVHVCVFRVCVCVCVCFGVFVCAVSTCVFSLSLCVVNSPECAFLKTPPETMSPYLSILPQVFRHFLASHTLGPFLSPNVLKMFMGVPGIPKVKSKGEYPCHDTVVPFVSLVVVRPCRFSSECEGWMRQYSCESISCH